MMEAWMGAVALGCLAAVFLVFPGWFLRTRKVADQAAANRAWYASRRTELNPEAADDAVLLQDAQLRFLDDGDTEAEAATLSAGPELRWLLLPLLVAAALFYWQLGAAPDVRLLQHLQSFNDESSAQEYRELMLAVEARAAQRPDNLHYQTMLGRFYMNENDYPRAQALYERLAAEVPGDASVKAMAAQAAYLAAGRSLDNSAQLLAEQSLSLDPHQSTALGLLGMAAYEKGQYQAAIGYWQRLLVMEDPNSSSAKMINDVITRAQAALAGDPAGSDHASAASASAQVMAEVVPEPTAAVGISLRIELAAGSPAPQPGDTLFVFARNPLVESRMPIAVQRLTAAQLPLTLRLDDSNSMAGQKLSALSQISVVARISPSGQPGEEFASWQAQLDDLKPGASGEVELLVLMPVASR